MSKSNNGAPVNSYAWDLAEGLPLLLYDGATSYVTGPGGLPRSRSPRPASSTSTTRNS